MAKIIKLEVELDSMKKAEITELCAKVGVEPHTKKNVMVNRLRYAIEAGDLKSIFQEPDFDSELEASTQPKPKKEKPVKAEKAPKIEIVFDWAESDYKGRQVYTSAGTGIITQETTDGIHFQVKLPNGDLKAVNASTTRFKAVNDHYRDRYIKDDTVRTESGSPSIHSGSDISYALLGTTMNEMAEIAAENGLTDVYKSYTEGRAKPLNAGMIRMNIGNILLGRLRKGLHVSIFGYDNQTMKQAAEAGKTRSDERAKEAAAAKIQTKADRAAAAEAAKAQKILDKAIKEEAKLAAKAQPKVKAAKVVKEEKAPRKARAKKVA